MAPANQFQIKQKNKTKRLLILGLIMGLTFFGVGNYFEKIENGKSSALAKLKLEKLFSIMNDLHHRRVQLYIDQYPNLAENVKIQNQLLELMEKNITNFDEAESIYVDLLKMDENFQQQLKEKSQQPNPELQTNIDELAKGMVMLTLSKKASR